MRLNQPRIFSAVLLGLVLARAGAQTTSLDCSKSAVGLEQAVCVDPVLANHDDNIARELKAALKPLSAAGKEGLHREQRSWLHYVAQICAANAAGADPLDARTLECLHGAYAVRESQLQGATLRAGHMVLRQVSSFAAHPNDSESSLAGIHPGFASSEISYPLIDNPSGPSQRAFNIRMAALVKKAGAGAGPNAAFTDDVSVAYEIHRADRQLLSVSVYSMDFVHGASEPRQGLHVLNWLVKQKRELRADDIFDTKKSWRPALAALVQQGLKSQEKACHCLDMSKASVGLIDSKLSANQWGIGQDGVLIQFLPHDLGGYKAGALRLVVPWGKLESYLAGRPAFTLRSR